MGVVYDAMQLGLHRPVAVKCLHHRYAKDANALARFQQEARIVGAIGHPNVVEVFDLGALEDGAPFLVMERLVGESLAAAMRRERPMSVPLATSVAAQVLAALQATHARAVLHRDLKPDNVFLVARSGAAPLVKVLDFGVARDLAATADPRLTRAGFVMGTPAYMAPEQARGEPLDVRVDVYGVGALLYEMLTGRVPYTARTPAVLLGEMLKGPVPSPVHLRPSLPRALDEVVMRCLAFDREGRYADAAATLQALLSAGEDDDDAPTTLVDGTPRVG
ncbi:MAG: serine/threonine-protein kinase [Polyangiales bacterium]